jgi:hypothetical protein
MRNEEEIRIRLKQIQEEIDQLEKQKTPTHFSQIDDELETLILIRNELNWILEEDKLKINCEKCALNSNDISNLPCRFCRIPKRRSYFIGIKELVNKNEGK